MMKRLICFLTAVILTALFSVTAAADTGKNYYIPRANGSTPELPKEERDILEYDGYYRDCRFTNESSDKVIYLTFDMGYVNENARSIVKTLRENGVSATFFILDHVACTEAELLKEMKADGHVIGNHTTNHKDMTKCSCEEMKKNLLSLEEHYKENTGYDLDKFFRFPEGRYSTECLKTAQSLGYKTVFWSFAYADWDNNRQPDKEASVKKILTNTHNGEIVLLHPTSKTNAEILGTLIAEWKNMGYRFATVAEL